jgi:hypothetical protein
MALTAIVHHRADWARRASIIALASSPGQPNPSIDVDPQEGKSRELLSLQSPFRMSNLQYLEVG